jgi:HAD superfamily hydrolase (TIGR01490 family)
MRMIAALFDLDGTLFSTPMGRAFIRYASSHGRRLRASLYFASMMPLFTLHKLKWLPQELMFRTAIRRMAWLIQGYDLSQGAEAFDKIVYEHILPSVREDILERWHEHRALDHQLVIVSGGLVPCLVRIGAHLSATGILGTKVEVIDDRYTGRVILPVMIGDEKGQSASRFFTERGLEVDWEASYAYADSIHDLPLFEIVGNQVAVYPDDGLRKLAKTRGWEIIG